MRRFATRIDQLPAWAFLVTGALAFTLARATRLFSLLRANRGGMELGSILTLAIFLLLVIFAVRRRHINALRSAGNLLAAIVAGNAFALVVIWPFVPGSYSISLVPVVRDTLLAGGTMALTTLPLAVLMLWLSRKLGSHSSLTERRVRLVQEALRRRLARDQGATR
jgi:hypothetical protein